MTLVATRVTLTPKRSEALAKEWVRSFERFDRAVLRCRRSLGEEPVHDVRLAARHCLPVIEVLQRLEPDEPLWSLTRQVVKGVAKALGPLRDAQVRRSRLKGMRGPGRKAGMARARVDEERARPLAKATLALAGKLPKRAMKEALKAEGAHDLLRAAIIGQLRHREQQLTERKQAARLADAASMHAMRIALKHYRYLLLAIEPCLAAAALRRLTGLKELQTAMGEFHDEHLFKQWLGTVGVNAALALSVRRSVAERKRSLAQRMRHGSIP